MKYLLSFVEEGIEVKVRSNKDNKFCKFVNFVQVREAHFQKMKMVTYHFYFPLGE